MGNSNAAIINYLVEDIVENSMDKDEIAFSDRAVRALENALKNNVSKIYRSNKVVTYEKYCNVMLGGLFDAYYEAVRNIDRAANSKTDAIRKFADFVNEHPQRDLPESEMPPAIFVTDYIAGMTDSYAIACFNELYKN